MRLFLLSVVGCFISLTIAGQDSGGVMYSRVNISPSIGYSIPSAHISKGKMIDYLHTYSLGGLTWQVFAGEFFINSHWGVAVAYPMYIHSENGDKNKLIEDKLNADFGDEYFLQEMELTNDIGDISIRALFGPTYRFEKGKAYFQTKLLFGISKFNTQDLDAYFKEKNSNNYFKYSVRSFGQSDDFFTVSPDFVFGYRVLNRFILNLNMQYYYFKSNLIVTEEFVNLYDGSGTMTEENDRSSIHSLSVSLGLTIELSRKVRYK